MITLSTYNSILMNKPRIISNFLQASKKRKVRQGNISISVFKVLLKMERNRVKPSIHFSVFLYLKIKLQEFEKINQLRSIIPIQNKIVSLYLVYKMQKNYSLLLSGNSSRKLKNSSSYMMSTAKKHYIKLIISLIKKI